ncbi:hypothetical protein EMPS_01001 [Entomortierella parvispora]|uniref:BHLH domain-containing protein n=1 Tax=Entomortierella parvispora TaxID=205924 RepID=A0A9P3H218_9FUNG|nr:hypothetical protein EMPS_01001 [Entomortierella parvispora]
MTTHQGAVVPPGSPNPPSPHSGYRERGHGEPHPGGGHPYPSYYHHHPPPAHPGAHHHGPSAQPYYPPSYPSYSHSYPHGHGPPPVHGYPPAQPGYAAHPHHHQQPHGYGAPPPHHPHHPQQHYPPGEHAGPSAGSPSPISETLSASAISSASKSIKGTPKTAKPKAGPKTKTTKAQQQAEQGSSETTKGASKATPKTFRFEGSISSESFKSTKSFDLAGVNILNRKPLDTKTALDKLQRRRETHNRVERKRRDCINQLIDDLTKLLPAKHLEEASSKCHRVNVLRGAVAHIKFLNESNHALNQSLRASRGEEPLPDLPTESESDQKAKAAIKDSEDRDMSMDLDNDTEMKEEEQDEEVVASQPGDTMSRSTTPASSLQASPTASPRRPVPPPVIVTNAPTSSAAVDPYSLESHRQRSNSFTTSVGDDHSPRSAYSSSPMFPPSPISPLPFARNSLFPPSESESSRDPQQLSPLMGHHSPSLSPSLPPISSLASLQLKSPSGRMNESSHEQPSVGSSPVPSSFSSRPHRGASTLPPLTIPQPHHLHPSYHQGYSNTGGNGSSTSGSNRSSLNLSPHPTDQPPVSPFMLSPMLSRSPSMGPISSASPGGSPYPHWHHDGTPSPQPYPPHGSPFTSPGAYPQGYTPNGGGSNSDNSNPTHPHPHARHKSLQPGPIFIQEEPWNVQRKRSTSSASGKSSSKASRTQEKRKADEAPAESGAVSPTSSVTSSASYPSSPNPKKRTQPSQRYDEGEGNDDEEMIKRTKQQEPSNNLDATTSHQRDSGVVVVVEAPPEGSAKTEVEAHEDAAQALTSLSRTAA